jgi:hypothetical protein
LSFGKGGQSAPFPSVLCVWGAAETIIEGLKKAFPSASHLSGSRVSPSGVLAPRTRTREHITFSNSPWARSTTNFT